MEMEIDYRTAAKQERYQIGADILQSMDKGHALPQPNQYELARQILIFYKDEGYEDDLKERGRKWDWSIGYWRRHLSDFDAVLRSRGKFFAYVREDGSTFHGEWKFCTQKEYFENMEVDNNDISTRVENHNEKVTDAKRKWKRFDIPALAGVKRLTS